MPECENKGGGEDWLSEELRVEEAILNGISDALMLLDASTYQILEVNEAFLRSYGLNRDEVLGEKCYEITHHLNKPCQQIDINCPCPLEDAASTGDMSQVEHVHQDKDGQTLYFEINAYPLKDASGKVTRIIHLSRNITQRKHLELQLREKEKLDAILELAGGASHEINQPLTVIISGLEQLVKRLKPNDLEHDLAQTILDHARRLREISEKLAHITRYASKDYPGGRRIVDLDQASARESES